MKLFEILPQPTQPTQSATKTAENNLMESEDLLDQKLFRIATAGGFDVLARQALTDYKAGKTAEI